METIDFDTDGNPDGIINLYTETGTTLADGFWNVDPRFAVVLDTSTGDVRTWEFFDATEDDTIDDYTFQLFNTTCGTDPVLTVNLILGPFSGVALPPGPNDANVEICSGVPFNLFEALTSDAITPAPHLNGSWLYVGSSSGANFDGTFELLGSSFSAEVPYEEGPPTVDNEVFELKYVVGGVTPCDALKETTVKVSVVRQVESGMSTVTNICESDILAGSWDADINLRDDDYLEGEDVEGYWLFEQDPTGQLSDPQDSFVNFREIYDAVIDGGNNLRFGCETFTFTYFVPQRSAVCASRQSSINFNLYEELRPFQQTDGIPELCINRSPASFDLFTLLEFTEINGVDFVYDDDSYVSWRQLSGPSDLGLLSQPDGPDLFIPDYEYHLGSINVNGAIPGTYVFEFGVTPDINCQFPDQICDPFVTDPMDPTFSNNPCDILFTTVTIELLPFDYAGEDTADLFFCETDTSVDLRSLLLTNGTDTIVDTGVWTDSENNTVDNTFVFPTVDTEETFTFTYTTTTDKNCAEEASLSFTVSPLANAGEGSSITLCSDDLRITLFDLLTGDPDPTGIWTGPFGYESEDNLGVFNPDDVMLPVLGAGEYTYTVPGNNGCVDGEIATVTVTIVDPIEIGQDVNETFCILDGRVSLFSILDRETIRTGVFEDTESTGALTPEGVVEFNLLPNPDNLVNPVYNFRYVVPNLDPCDESSLNVAIQVIDLPEPVVGDQQFCILDAKRLDDIEVDVLNYNWYRTLESDTPIVDNPLLFDNDIYYITNVDADNCESERVQVSIDILNTGERFDNGELCTLDFQDGVSPDGNNQNDTFALFIEDEFNIPVAFPDFDLKIYNRYGTQVFEGNLNTEEFRGESNTSVRLGDDLPSGTYFYIFTPNFDNNLPIQGSFYLAR